MQSAGAVIYWLHDPSGGVLKFFLSFRTIQTHLFLQSINANELFYSDAAVSFYNLLRFVAVHKNQKAQHWIYSHLLMLHISTITLNLKRNLQC